MASIVIVFASMTGNTEEMADLIAEGVRAEGVTLELKSVLDVNASILEKHDGVLLGAYTWGDGDLPDEFLDFYEEMDDIRLDGKKAGVFGSGDTSYTHFGAAVDTLLEKLEEIGASTETGGFKVELNPSADEKDKLIELGRNFAKLVASGS